VLTTAAILFDTVQREILIKRLTYLQPEYLETKECMTTMTHPSHLQTHDWPSLDPSSTTATDWEMLMHHDDEDEFGVDDEFVPVSLTDSMPSSPIDDDDDDVIEIHDHDELQGTGNEMLEDASFSLVSGPGSVYSVSTHAMTTVGTLKHGMTFRDAILQSSTTTTTSDALSVYTESEPMKPTRWTSPRFVVKPIRRQCRPYANTRLAPAIEEELDEDGDEDSVGAAYASEIYQPKSAGERRRMVANKLRPDEAKRLQMIMHKKALQRQQQQGR
jgi:hypothetical protein